MMSKTKADKMYEKNVAEFLINISKDPDKVLALIDAICMEKHYLYQCSICEATITSKYTYIPRSTVRCYGSSAWFEEKYQKEVRALLLAMEFDLFLNRYQLSFADGVDLLENAMMSYKKEEGISVEKDKET